MTSVLLCFHLASDRPHSENGTTSKSRINITFLPSTHDDVGSCVPRVLSYSASYIDGLQELYTRLATWWQTDFFPVATRGTAAKKKIPWAVTPKKKKDFGDMWATSLKLKGRHLWLLGFFSHIKGTGVFFRRIRRRIKVLPFNPGFNHHTPPPSHSLPCCSPLKCTWSEFGDNPLVLVIENGSKCWLLAGQKHVWTR